MFNELSGIISVYGALGVFLAAFTEEVIVPIPSALVMMSAGFFMLGQQALAADTFILLFTHVALPIALGLTLGSLVTYGLAYRFGKPAIERWGRYLAVTWQDVEKLERHFSRGWADEAVFFFLRLVPVIPSVVINIFSGLTRLPLAKYLALTFFGILVRAYVVGFLGWQIGGAFSRYGHYFSKLEGWGLLAVLVVLAFFWHRRSRAKKSRD